MKPIALPPLPLPPYGPTFQQHTQTHEGMRTPLNAVKSIFFAKNKPKLFPLINVLIELQGRKNINFDW